jgi:hypothetical protein
MGRLRQARFALVSLNARVHHRRVAHFLHIGKNAGTALKRALREAPDSEQYQLALHTHGVRMTDLPRGDKFFFIVRDPVDRFTSAFYSRLRQGAPRFHQPWTEAEARAFARFRDAASLAAALADDGEPHDAAVDAMHSIEHVRTSYWDWFGDPSAFERRSPDVLWIGFTEHLDGQLPDLAARLGLGALALPSDETAAHRGTNRDVVLPAEARDALTAWYARDYDFVARCRDLSVRL